MTEADKNNFQKVIFHNLGFGDYKEIWDFQEKLFNEALQKKEKNDPGLLHHLIFCEHPHVYTLGKSGDKKNLLIDYIQMQAKNAQFYHINRGGDITYHGPGQLVGYPILSLNHLNIGLKEYIHKLEEVIIRSIDYYKIKGSRMNGATGVWLDPESGYNARKICAIGVRTSRWVTMHGFALNINTDLSYFGYINPCGYTDKTVTSIEKEIGVKADFSEVSKMVLKKFQEVFGVEIINS